MKLKRTPKDFALCTCITYALACSLVLGGPDDGTEETGACCLDYPGNGQVYCDILTMAVCEDAGGIYYGDGTTCADAGLECEEPEYTGACCFEAVGAPILVCQQKSHVDCDAINGVYYGDGSSCNDPGVDCGPKIGACCYVNALGLPLCVEVTLVDCQGLQGFYYGDNTFCNDPNIECPPDNENEGACCYGNDFTLSCFLTNESYCNTVGGFWYGYGSNCNSPYVRCTPKTENYGACCHENSDTGQLCNNMSEDDCAVMDGSWNGPDSSCNDGGGTICNVPPPSPSDCVLKAAIDCAGRPNYQDLAFSDVFGEGRLLVETASPVETDYVLTVFDMTTINSEPMNAAFPINRYSDPRWTQDNLGSIFGLTLDSDGAIYTTATRTWNHDIMGPGGWGAVYRIDPWTGDITLFTALPNTSDGPGLGNISYHCDSNMFFITNFHDGKIYRVDAGGLILDSFDHGSPWDGTVIAPLGERVWAVEAHRDRLYYSVWNEDSANKDSAKANEIWSIGLDATGAFIGTAKFEFAVSEYAFDGATAYSSPVSDISFTPRGGMLLSERSMNDWDASFPPESLGLGMSDARALEFECINGSWVENIGVFSIGSPFPHYNAAGGIDVGDELVYVSGDVLHTGTNDKIFGFQVLPSGGGAIANSHLVDYEGDLSDADVLPSLGDVELTGRDETCIPFEPTLVECWYSPNPPYYSMNFKLVQDATQDITSITITPPVGITLGQSSFQGPFVPQSDYLLQTTVSGASAGFKCFVITSHWQHGGSCQSIICVDFPECYTGDFDYNLAIDVFDLLFVLAHWGNTCEEYQPCPGDGDGNGRVDVLDLLTVISNWTR